MEQEHSEKTIFQKIVLLTKQLQQFPGIGKPGNDSGSGKRFPGSNSRSTNFIIIKFYLNDWITQIIAHPHVVRNTCSTANQRQTHIVRTRTWVICYIILNSWTVFPYEIIKYYVFNLYTKHVHVRMRFIQKKQPETTKRIDNRMV